MANIVLRFNTNPKNKDQLIGFFKKRIFFIVNNSGVTVNPGEYWECFIWAEKPNYTLVKPYKKVETEKVDDTIKKVTSFNDVLRKIETYMKNNPDFDKVIFDENNKSYIKTKNLKLKEAYQKYDSYIVKKLNDMIVVRPILTEDDRKEWRQLSQLR
ncbi:MAG: hypothetical protein WC755_04795 [Candidatus Woesearchaeota archaeon]|jgi:hypothetical protein